MAQNTSKCNCVTSLQFKRLHYFLTIFGLVMTLAIGFKI